MSTTRSQAMPIPLRSEPITYRQLDYWIRRFPDLFSNDAQDVGTGVRRDLTHRDIDRLRTMARLTAVGIRLDVAAQLAADGGGYHRLSPHIVMRVSA